MWNFISNLNWFTRGFGCGFIRQLRDECISCECDSYVKIVKYFLNIKLLKNLKSKF